MRKKNHFGMPLAGFLAGAVNGLFGAGGGMVLVPLLSSVTDLDDTQVFPASVSIILPVCLVSLSFSLGKTAVIWADAIPYLIGSAAGGVAAGLWGRKMPVKWLHRILGLFIVWGGVRYLC